MGLLYIIISLLFNDEVHSVFEIMKSPNPLSWQKALFRCDSSKSNSYIAVPTVNLTTMRITDAIALDEEAWVGYFQSYEHFLFIDCVPLSVVNSVEYARYSIGRNNNRPGMCYSLCGLQGYIGLQDGNCYCIDGKNFSTKNTIPFNSTCTNPLQCGNGMLCGYEGHSMISVYMNVSMSSMSSHDMKGDGSGCLLVSKYKDYEMSVVDCTSKYRHLCEAQIGKTLSLEESEETEPWLHSMKYCGETFKRPTTFLGDITRYIFPNISGSWWATVVRDLVIRNCSETCTKIRKPLCEGYLKKSSDDGIKLEFVQAKDKSVKKSVACMSGETRKTSTSDPATFPKTSKATITTFVSGEKMTVITTPEKSSTDPVTTPTTSKSTKTTSVSGEKMNNSTTVKTVTTPKRSSSEPATTPTTSTSTITTFVSVLTPIVSIIAVVSLTVVCWRRRNEKATVHVQAPKEKTTKHVVPRDPEGHETLHQPNENYQSHASSDTFKENNVPCSANKMNLYDTANFNIDDGTYDVTFSVNNPIRAVQANSYDHVRLKKTNDGKYDHVDLQDQNNTAYELDTYDKTNALTLDNTQYNTFQEKFKPHQQFKANVYDAANFHPTK